MSSDPSKQPAAAAPQGGAPPTAGAPGAAPGAYPPPPGQPPYPYPPPGGYGMPPAGYYPPPGGYYPPPPGQYPQYPAYYPGPYGAPPPGQYPPPPGQYPYPGYYPPPPGAHEAPPTGQAVTAPPPGQPQTGAPAPSPVGGFVPPAGSPYPPPGSVPYTMPVAVGGYPGAAAPGAYYPPPPAMGHPAHRDPLVYLGTSIPDPEAPPAQLGVQKVNGYDPATDYNAISRALISGVGDEKQRQSPSPHSSPSALSPVASSSSAPPLSQKDQKGQTSAASFSSSNGTLSGGKTTAVPLKSSTSKSPPSSRAFLNNRLGAMLTLTTDSTRTVLDVMKRLNIFQIDALNDYCTAKSGITLADRLEKATSGNFGLGIRALALGPLWYDVELAHKSLVGIGTNETLLIELILGRPGHEIRWLKTAYRKRYGRDLVDTVRGDLSGKLERLFIMALNTQKPDDSPLAVVDPAKVNADVHSLHQAAQKKDEITFCEVLVNRSNAHIAAVITAYSQQYKSLSKVIKKTFSGTMENALLYIMHGAKSKRDGQGFWRDAKLLEKSMAGLGTKDTQLIYRLVRAHWDPHRMESVKDAYKRRYGKALENRVKGETSGLYRDLLIELVKSGKH